MKRILGTLVTLSLLGVCSRSGHAGSVDGTAGAGADAQVQIGRHVAARANANAETQAAADARLAEIRRKAAKVSEEKRAKAEAKLEAARARVDQAAERGGSEVARRLASELNVGAEALIEQRTELKCGWGELVIAHTLAANNTEAVTVDQLVQLRRDGMGWGMIAAGLGLELGDATKAVDAETRVALGLSKPDGKIAHVTDTDATAHAAVGAGTSAQAGPALVGAGASLNSGAAVSVPKIGIGR